MTQAISKEQALLENIKALTFQQQQEVLEFIEFLQFKAQKQAIPKDKEENQPISAYEAAKQWAGCVDSEVGDLSTNKAYLEGFGKE